MINHRMSVEEALSFKRYMLHRLHPLFVTEQYAAGLPRKRTIKFRRYPTPKEEKTMSDDTAKIEMPEYTCHKKVHGLKIAEIVRVDPGETGPLGDRSGLMVPEDTRYGAIPFDTAFSDKHNPQIGDYYVVYKDGYKSISPEEAFESGYTMVEVTKHGPEKEPPTYQERVSDEKAELDDKRMKLIAFTNTETFRHLNSHDQMLMRHQADKMRGYSSVLNARIDRFIRP